MSREKPREIYKAKVTRFGTGAKLKAYKSHINKEVIIMTKDVYKEFLDKFNKNKDKKFTQKDSDELDELDDVMSDKLEVE